MKMCDMSDIYAPTILSVWHVGAMADRAQVNARVRYGDAEPQIVRFLGPACGIGPVLTEIWEGEWVRVVNPGRLGEFGTNWVRRYFGEES